MNANSAAAVQGHGVEPDATSFPRSSLTILQSAAPTQPAETEPETGAPTVIAPPGRAQETWQAVEEEVVVTVVEALMLVDVLKGVVVELLVEVLDVVELDDDCVEIELTELVDVIVVADVVEVIDVVVVVDVVDVGVLDVEEVDEVEDEVLEADVALVVAEVDDVADEALLAVVDSLVVRPAEVATEVEASVDELEVVCDGVPPELKV